jgi:hypothetical protein
MEATKEPEVGSDLSLVLDAGAQSRRGCVRAAAANAARATRGECSGVAVAESSRYQEVGLSWCVAMWGWHGGVTLHVMSTARYPALNATRCCVDDHTFTGLLTLLVWRSPQRSGRQQPARCPCRHGLLVLSPSETARVWQHRCPHAHHYYQISSPPAGDGLLREYSLEQRLLFHVPGATCKPVPGRCAEQVAEPNMCSSRSMNPQANCDPLYRVSSGT